MLLLHLTGLIFGLVFTYIVGYLDTADYLIEQWSIWILEIPSIVLIAVMVKKTGWRRFLFYAVFGVLSSWSLTFGEGSITPLVYAKVSMTGMILGECSLFSESFGRRFMAVAAPAVIIAFIVGLPIIFQDGNPEAVDRFRNDSLELYNTFMSGDEAKNAADNAVFMFESLFKAGFAVFMIAALIYAWCSFQALSLFAGRFCETKDHIISFREMKLPFVLVWPFLLSFGFILLEYEPLMPLALNSFVVMVFLYLVQGMAVILYHMHRLELGRLPRIALWFFIFFTLIFSGLVLVVVGLADNWFDLRPKRDENSINVTM